MALERRGRASRGEVSPAALLAVLAVTLVWRLPSFFDPPWVNDEGTYFAVAGAMAHGYRLYRDVWENKPPALYLMYEGVYHWLGPSLPAVRILAALAVLGTVVLVVAVTVTYSIRTALLAGLLLGLLMGVPFLEGTTANAEVFLVLCTTGAVALAQRGRRALPGLLMGVAVLFKVVALFDAAALGLFILGFCNGIGPRNGRLRGAAIYTLALSLPVVLTVLAAAGAGNLESMLRDAVLYPLGYVGHANGGSIPWLVLVKVLTLAVGTVLLRGRAYPALWLLWATAGALISGRFFGHYALQAVPALVVVLAMVADRFASPVVQRRALTALPLLFLALALGSALIGRTLAATEHDTILARRLQWYPNFVRMAVGAESYSTYRNQVDDHVSRNIAVARALRRLPPGPLLVWGNTPWIYVLSGRLPATPYTSALRDPEVPGETAALRRAVARRSAAVVVVVTPPLPPLGSARRYLERQYRRVRRVSDATLYAALVRQAPRRAR